MVSKRSTKKKLLCSILILFLSLLISTKSLVLHTQSQFEIFPDYLGLASIIPFQGQEDLSLINSEIVMRAEFDDATEEMSFHYECNHNISNTGATNNATIVVPISAVLYYYVSVDYSAYVNNTALEIDVLESEYREELDQYLGDYTYEYILLNNTILQGNSVTTLSFFMSFDIDFSKGRSAKILTLFYEVGAINLWDNYKTKSIRYLVSGVQPFNYSDYSATTPERKCTVTYFETGTDYYWHWEDEDIIEDLIYVEWLIPRDKPFTFLVHWDLYSYIALAIISLFIVFVKRTKRKRRREYG